MASTSSIRSILSKNHLDDIQQHIVNGAYALSATFDGISVFVAWSWDKSGNLIFCLEDSREQAIASVFDQVNVTLKLDGSAYDDQ